MLGRSFAGDIDQQTRIGMLYGGWYTNLDRNNTLLVTGTAGYGWTENKMNSLHTGDWSRGKWTNETLFGMLNGKWSRRLNGAVILDVMLGWSIRTPRRKRLRKRDGMRAALKGGI